MRKQKTIRRVRVKMYYLESPDIPIRWSELPRPWIFLAGGITGCPDWQQDVRKAMENYDCTIFNPRRADFDITDPNASRVQVEWEYKRLQEADLVSFWFAKETIQPIVLYELGFFMGKVYGKSINEGKLHDQALLIGCHPEYPRVQDVRLQTENVNYEFERLMVYSFEAYVDVMRQAVQTYKEMENE